MASSDSCLITPHLTPSPTPSPAPSTPNPFPRPTEIPSEDEERYEATLWHHFRGWALSERSRETNSWAWPFKYNIQKDE
ncbi:restless-like transposase [Ilyonectria robusta]